MNQQKWNPKVADAQYGVRVFHCKNNEPLVDGWFLIHSAGLALCKPEVASHRKGTLHLDWQVVHCNSKRCIGIPRSFEVAKTRLLEMVQTGVDWWEPVEVLVQIEAARRANRHAQR